MDQANVRFSKAVDQIKFLADSLPVASAPVADIPEKVTEETTKDAPKEVAKEETKKEKKEKKEWIRSSTAELSDQLQSISESWSDSSLFFKFWKDHAYAQCVFASRRACLTIYFCAKLTIPNT